MIRIGLASVGVGLLAAGAIISVPQFTSVTYSPGNAEVTKEFTSTSSEEVVEVAPVIDDRPVVQHVPIPEAVKTIYMSACVVGTPSFREQLVALTEATEVNSIMIDIKDFSGSIAFDPVDEDWQYAWDAAECGAWDLKEFIAELHEKGIYVIGRITVFQDPLLTSIKPELAVKKADGVTVWEDYKGLSFIDVSAREYWDHVVALTRESYNLGFDEINFDYIRYPSDGPMGDIAFTHSSSSPYGYDKQANLEAFFAYLYEQISDPDLYADIKHENTGRDVAIPYTSADLFGMTTTNYDDLSIGQIQERAMPYFDFIAPMVYPSHYPDGSFGYPDPNLVPYEIVYTAMKSGVDRAKSSTTPLEGFTHEALYSTNASGTKIATGEFSKQVFSGDNFRTWIQDFDYGGDYDAADVRAQIQASYDAGVDSWMIWSPSNRYTRGGLLDAGVLAVGE